MGNSELERINLEEIDIEKIDELIRELQKIKEQALSAALDIPEILEDDDDLEGGEPEQSEAENGTEVEAEPESAETEAVPEAEVHSEAESASETADTSQSEEDKLHAVPSQVQRDILIERIGQKKRYRRTLTTTVTVLAFIAAVAVFIAMVLCPVIKVSGSGMEPLYKSGDIIVLFNAKEYEGGELCCISYQNKLLVKRVIAKPGDKVNIDESGNVSVNGELLDEPYAINKSVGECDVEFPLVVPEGAYFVLGDRRDTSIDSRSTLIGCVNEKDIVGKVLIKVWPFDSNNEQA